jgi:hypothetical protein
MADALIEEMTSSVCEGCGKVAMYCDCYAGYYEYDKLKKKRAAKLSANKRKPSLKRRNHKVATAVR